MRSVVTMSVDAVLKFWLDELINPAGTTVQRHWIRKSEIGF